MCVMVSMRCGAGWLAASGMLERYSVSSRRRSSEVQTDPSWKLEDASATRLNLIKKQKEILEEFNKIESNKPDPVIKTFFEKAKKFWRNS